MYFYTVRCKFASDQREEISSRWLDWLKHGHIQDVMNGGAIGADILKMTSSDAELEFEIRYRFPNHATFLKYEADFAPGLREEGLAKFPTALGIHYERTTGEMLASFGEAGEV